MRFPTKQTNISKSSENKNQFQDLNSNIFILDLSLGLKFYETNIFIKHNYS